MYMLILTATERGTMKLATFRSNGEDAVGIVLPDGIVPLALAAPDAPLTMRAVLSWMPDNDVDLAGAPALPLESVQLLPVVPDPGAVCKAGTCQLNPVSAGGQSAV